MKTIATLFTGLLLLCTSIEAGLAPQVAYNEKKHAYAGNIKIENIEGEIIHVATYANGIIYTNLTGYFAGMQWIEDSDGNRMATSEEVKYHDHSFTHTYKGGKVKTYKKSGGKAWGQMITYDRN